MLIIKYHNYVCIETLDAYTCAKYTIFLIDVPTCKYSRAISEHELTIIVESLLIQVNYPRFFRDLHISVL